MEDGSQPRSDWPSAAASLDESLTRLLQRLTAAEADLRLELGLQLSEDERELLWVRSQVVLASAAAGLSAPVAAVSTEVRDLDQLRHTTTALKQLGFRGRACLDPVQVPVVNEVFGDLPG